MDNENPSLSPAGQLTALLTVFAIVLVGLFVGFFLGGRKRTAVEPKIAAHATATPATPTPAPVPTATPLPSVEETLSTLDGARMVAHVRYLSQTLGPRPVGSSNDRRAADYVERQFKSYGYPPQRQWFQAKSGDRSCNVLARVATPGARRLVIGAHYDSVSRAPGANDNASGVAVLLEVARVLRTHHPAFDVTFVAFGSEEGAHDGSKYYVRNLDKANWPHGMINMDMVGVGQTFVLGTWKHPDQWLARHCAAASDRWQGGAKYPSPFGGKSDYEPFANAGIPIACMAWDDDPNYHTARDSLQYINEGAFAQRLGKTARVLAAALLTPENGFETLSAKPGENK